MSKIVLLNLMAFYGIVDIRVVLRKQRFQKCPRIKIISIFKA